MTIHEACAVLSVSPTASREEVARTYREMVEAWNPDQCGADLSLRRFCERKIALLHRAFWLLRNGVPLPVSRPAKTQPATKWTARMRRRFKLPGSDPHPLVHTSLVFRMNALDEDAGKKVFQILAWAVQLALLLYLFWVARACK
jgi:hypothetical protein